MRTHTARLVFGVATVVFVGSLSSLGLRYARLQEVQTQSVLGQMDRRRYLPTGPGDGRPRVSGQWTRWGRIVLLYALPSLSACVCGRGGRSWVDLGWEVLDPRVVGSLGATLETWISVSWLTVLTNNVVLLQWCQSDSECSVRCECSLPVSYSILVYDFDPVLGLLAL